MSGQRSLLVCYDISTPKRLRKVEHIMSGYGYRIQESVFFCRSSALLKARLEQELLEVIDKGADQCLIWDLGGEPDVWDNAVVLGKKIINIPKITLI